MILVGNFIAGMQVCCITSGPKASNVAKEGNTDTKDTFAKYGVLPEKAKTTKDGDFTQHANYAASEREALKASHKTP